MVTKTCAEQFPGRPVLGTCTRSESIIGKASGREVLLHRITHFYAYADVFESRANMRERLKSGAEWTSVSEDSQEYRRARLDRHARQLLK